MKNRPAVIIRYSEIAVKGPLTRRRMEDLLSHHIARVIEKYELKGTLSKTPGRIILWDPRDPYEAAEKISYVFGVKSTSPAMAYTLYSLEEIVNVGKSIFYDKVAGKTFRVTTRRTGTHEFTSKDVERALGAALFREGETKVDLTNPEYTVYVEIRGNTVFYYDKVIPGPGGLPVGSEEPVLVLFSGGFDSTATAWYIMRRGATPGLIYYDLGVEEAKENAVIIAEKLAEIWVHGWDLRLYIADMTPVVERLAEIIRPEYRTLIIRRIMLEHASVFAETRGYEALATGDNIGQVASQTIRNLRLIGGGIRLPVIRPVSGHDKEEIMKLIAKIGLYSYVNVQIEPCRIRVNPVPRASPKIYKEELEKAYRAIGEGLGDVIKIKEEYRFKG
ncbi:MAG: THUMP domain-containing protein [Desulfurococcales archaeon]|nr:THUMP domain-containing protein [Desulfurococcales archaeon]